VGESKEPRGTPCPAVPEPARQALLAIRRRQAEDRLRTGSAWKDTDGRVVTAATGGVPSLNRCKDTLDRLCEQADVPRLTVHQRRHQCTRLLFASGADVKQMLHYLGQSRASVTLDVYTHLVGGSDGEMAKRLEELLHLLSRPSPTQGSGDADPASCGCCPVSHRRAETLGYGQRYRRTALEHYRRSLATLATSRRDPGLIRELRIVRRDRSSRCPLNWMARPWRVEDSPLQTPVAAWCSLRLVSNATAGAHPPRAAPTALP
jgi:hypothetical protein